LSRGGFGHLFFAAFASLRRSARQSILDVDALCRVLGISNPQLPRNKAPQQLQIHLKRCSHDSKCLIWQKREDKMRLDAIGLSYILWKSEN